MSGRLLPAALGAVGLALLLAVSWYTRAAAWTASDFPTSFQVRVTNGTGGALARPVPFTVNALNLVSGGYLNAGGSNLAFASPAGTEAEGMAQNLSANGYPWWVDVDLAAGQTSDYRVYLGGAAVTRDQPWYFYNDGVVSVPDAASLDITTNLTLSTRARLVTIPVADAWLMNKPGAYALGLRGGNTLVGRIWQSFSATLTTNAAGDATALTPSGCVNNWDCVTATSDGKGVITVDGAGTFQDNYNVTDFAPTTDVYNISVKVACSTTAIAGDQTWVGVRLGGVTGTLVNATAGCASLPAFARPGGGSWTATDLDTVQLVVEHRDVVTTTGMTTDYAAISVTYDAPVEVTYVGIAAATTYTLAMTYDGAALKLLVDGAEAASSAVAGAVATSAYNITIGAGITGWLDNAKVGDTSVAAPTWKVALAFEPDEITQTDAGDAGDGWGWEGWVEDTTAFNNDATYAFTRDTTGITVTVFPVSYTPAPAISLLTPTPPNLLGTPDPSGLFQRPTPVPSSITDPMREMATESGMDPDAWWLLLGTIIGVAVGALTYRVIASWTLAGLAFGGVLWAAEAIGGFEPQLLAVTLIGVYAMWSIHKFWTTGGSEASG